MTPTWTEAWCQGAEGARAMKRSAGCEFYIDELFRRWELQDAPPKVVRSLRRVLGELVAEALLFLRDDRLQVICAGGGMWAWASDVASQGSLIQRA